MEEIVNTVECVICHGGHADAREDEAAEGCAPERGRILRVDGDEVGALDLQLI